MLLKEKMERTIINFLSLQYPKVKIKRVKIPKSVPDLLIPEARHGYSGLYLILAPEGKKLNRKDTKIVNRLIEKGYYISFCPDFNRATKEIDTYLLSSDLYCEKLGIPPKEKARIKQAS